jgi:peptidoglycan/LPS O-acetylase OafA/YrhL
LQEARRVRIGDHGEYGDFARTVSFLLLGVVVALYALDRWRSHERMRAAPRWLVPVVALLTVAGAIGATASVVVAGHTGAKVVWNEQHGQAAP